MISPRHALRRVSSIAVLHCALLLNACGDDSSAPTPAVAPAPQPDPVALGGTVSGLATGASVTLKNSDTDPLTLTANGTFTFASKVAYNGSYTVTVAAQPTGAVCTTQNGSGSGATANVTNVTVTCSDNTYTIGGALAGLPSGATVTVQNNGADDLTRTADGAFTFAVPVSYNSAYVVTVDTQPSGATCSVQHGSGAGVTQDVSDVEVSCSPNVYAIGGSVAGLASGKQVTLNNNGADALTATADGAFTFSTPVVYHGDYNVTIGTQPVGQTCTVNNGSGTELEAIVTNISINCSTDTHTVGGTVTGLAGGAQVTLDNNGADPLTVNADGSFVFATPVVYNSAYSVTVGTQPAGQSCVVSNGADIAIADVANVSVSCMDLVYTFITPGSSTWTVPSGVTTIQIVAVGGGGGGGGKWGAYDGTAGGAGAMVTSTRTVTAGEVLNLLVGAGGGAGASGPGDLSSWICGASGGGGGSSNVDAGTSGQIIAGGGGGGSSCGSAGAGGTGAASNTAAGGNGANAPGATGGSGGNAGTGGAGGNSMGSFGASGGNGNGGTGGSGAPNGGSYPGGTGGASVGTGIGGSATQSIRGGGGGGGYGGGGSGRSKSGGGAGGSTGPAGTTYSPATNAGATAINGGNGSIVITIVP